MKITLMILWSVILSTLSAAQAPISCAKPGSNGQNYGTQKLVQPPYPYYAPPAYPMTWAQQSVNPYMQRGPMQPNGQAMVPQQAMQPGFVSGASPQQHIGNDFVNSNGSVATFPQQSAQTGVQYGNTTPPVACSCGVKPGQKIIAAGSVATFPQQSAQTGVQYGNTTPSEACSCGMNPGQKILAAGSVATFPQQSAQTGVQYGNITPSEACSCGVKPGQKILAAANGATPGGAINSQLTDPKIIAAEQKVTQRAIETAKAAAEAQKIANESLVNSTQKADEAAQRVAEATQESVAKQNKADELAIVAQNALAAIPASAANDDGVVKLYAGMAADPQHSLPGTSVTEEKEGIKVIYSDSSAPVIIRPNKLTSAQTEVLKAQAAEPDHQVVTSAAAVSSAPAPASPVATDAKSALNAELDKMNSFSQSQTPSA